MNDTLTATPTKHTSGDWLWQSFDGGKTVFLCTSHGGSLIVMDFVRVGFNGAGPRFALGRNGRDRGGLMKSLSLDEIRRHPDACLLAAAPALLKLAEKYASECAECNGTGVVERTIGGDGEGGRCAARADVPIVCSQCEDIRKIIAKAKPPTS